MLQPNMPRFVRVGDKANIAASLMNLSDKGVKGTVRMELFNPETEKVFYSQKQKFDVKGGETGHVNFTFEVSDKYAVMACRMVADGDTFSDGEQRYIPVLTDKQWVTETVPLNVNGEGAHTFSLENLFNKHSKTASEQRLTVEFTAHPAWYAVQALPVVAHPQNEDALSWATAYYAHSLAAYIVKENPRIKQVFDSWKAQGGTKETFMSNLQKNQELKNILLAETPWLAEATNEAEQKQRIATLFDLNTMNSQLAVSVEKLGELQNADGAWSWYKGAALYAGMDIVQITNHSIPSPYVTKGRDATVSNGSMDFVFKNNNNNPIIVHNEIFENKIVSKIYGCSSDKRNIEIETEIVETIKNKKIYKSDSKLQKGTKVVEQEGRLGYTVNTFRLYKSNNEILKKELVNTSYYPPCDEIILKGTKDNTLYK